MAAIVIVAGGMLGFVSAVFSLFLGFGFLAAFGLWVAIGTGSSALAGAFALMPRRSSVPARA